jgi:hypothetical protein
MPEAAMDKHDLSESGKNKIRVSRQISPMQSKPVAHPMRQPPNGHLRCSIDGSDGSHQA